MVFALTGARIFDGRLFHEAMAVVVDGKKILSIEPISSLSASIDRVGLDGGLLAPGFIDVQVNGGGGALLKDIDRLLMEETGLPVFIAEDPLTCVARGGCRVLEMIEEHGTDILALE